ncbi:MAG: Ser-Thr-rich GPI-anchored membrane family protein [Patescibacteria group bacterium]
MKGYKRYVLGSVLAGFLAVVLMAPAGSAEAFWPFGKAKKENNANNANNANYAGAVANTKGESKIATSTITVVSPNGGETLQGGKSYTIKWKTKGISKKEKVSILLEVADDDRGISIATSTTNSGVYKWKVPGNVSGSNFKVAVTLKSVWDKSDEFFSIVAKNSFPKIIESPIISDDIKVGQTVDLVWNATDADNDDLAWRIDFGDGEAIGTDCESIHLKNGKNWEMRTSHSWRKKGVYGVHTVVKDCVSGSDKDAFDIDIENL